MLQQDEPDDYVIATGETHTIREFLDEAFACAGYDDWASYVKQDARFERPAEVDLLMGDATQGARRSSAGSPRSTSRASCAGCTSRTSPRRAPRRDQDR